MKRIISALAVFVMALMVVGSQSTAMTASFSAPNPPVFNPVALAYTVGSGGDYADLQSAITDLNKRVLPVGAFATLTILDGTITANAAVLVSTSFGRQINITAQHPPSTTGYHHTLNSIQSSSGSAGAWSVVLNLDSIANIAVNDYIIISNASGGTLPTYIDGVFKVTNVDAGNTRITVSSTHQNASAPSGNVTGTVNVMKSILAFTGVNGIDIWNGGSALNLNNVVIAGDNTGGTIGVDLEDVNRLYVQNILGVTGFGSAGILVNLNSEANSDGVVVVSGNGKGVNVTSSGAFGTVTLISSGNTSDGAYSNGGYLRSGATGVFTGNGGNGAYSTSNGILSVASTTSTGNTGKGYRADAQAWIDASSTTSTGNGSSTDQTAFTISVPMNPGTFTVSGLPTPANAGAIAYISDGNAGCSAGATPVGGGSTKCFVGWNGSAWKEFGI